MLFLAFSLTACLARMGILSEAVRFFTCEGTGTGIL